MTIFLLQPIFGRKEDYLMGINFSRVLTLRYGNSVSNYLNTKYQAISVGRVMTLCAWNGSAKRTRDPCVCENSVLPRTQLHCP